VTEPRGLTTERQVVRLRRVKPGPVDSRTHVGEGPIGTLPAEQIDPTLSKEKGTMLRPETLAHLAWRRVLLAGAVAVVAAYVVITLVITLYGTVLGFRMRGELDPAQITAFADGFIPWAAPLALALSTLIAAAWAARRIPSVPALQGFTVGAFVAVLGLTLDLRSGTAPVPLFATAASALLAGWLGGRLGGRAGAPPPSDAA
jgi:putative membrane protein (TIGR04086 family)